MQYFLVIAVAFLTYLKSVEYNYVVDDENASRTNQGNKKSKISPVQIAGMFYGAGLFEDKRVDHLFKIALTATIGCLILLCFNNVWVALLWVVHPVNNQTTLWLNGRRYQMSLILGLLSYKFPIAGIILFPLSVYVHPISAPLIVVTAVMVTPTAWLWALPSLFTIKRMLNWLECRFQIQNFDVYRNFNWRKPVLAVKCLSEYVRHCLFPTGFTMYHPEIWGVAELPGNKHRCYALNAQFWLCLALISLIAYTGWFIGGSCIVGLLIAFAGIIQWLGIAINPTQLWSQRYASLMSIGMMIYVVGVAEFTGYHTIVLSCVFVGYLVVTLKDMEMYRDLFSFYWMHFIHQPNNQNAALFGSLMAFPGYSSVAREQKKPTLDAIYSSNSMASALLWCYRNKKPDMLHEFVHKQFSGLKRKPPKKEGA